MRKRYMISWKYNDVIGRDHWVMERRGKLSPADIKQQEFLIAEKWGYPGAVTITNFVAIN